jgi:hypothetical protein
MKNIKTYYIFLLSNIVKDKWSIIYNHFKLGRQPLILENTKIDAKGNRIKKSRSVGVTETSSIQGSSLIRMTSENPAIIKNNEVVQGTSGVYVTTKDSYTLTDGPTIFISNDIEKIAKFCVQQANIPASIMDDIMKKIEYNNSINEKLFELETEFDAIKEESEKQIRNEVKSFGDGKKVSGRNKTGKDLNKFGRDIPDGVARSGTGNLNKLTEEINALRAMIKTAALNDGFVPNKKMHLDKWAEGIEYNNVFTSNVDDTFVSDIMALKGVDNLWKVLLMMGIGVFINHENITYTDHGIHTLIFVSDHDIRQLINNLECIYYSFGTLTHDNIYKFIDKPKTFYITEILKACFDKNFTKAIVTIKNLYYKINHSFR